MTSAGQLYANQRRDFQLAILASDRHAARARGGGRPRHRGPPGPLPEGRGLPGGRRGRRKKGPGTDPGGDLPAPRPRPAAPRPRRARALRGGPAGQANPRRSGGHPHRTRRRIGPHRGPGDGGRRLRGQALQPEGAGGPGAGPLPAPRAARRGRAVPDPRGARGGPHPPHRARGRAAGAPHGQGVRPAGRPPGGPRARPLPGKAARRCVGLLLRRRDAHGGRARAAPAREAPRPGPLHRDREVPGVPAGRRDGRGKPVTLGLRSRMMVTAVAAAAAALLAVHFLAEPELRRRALDQTRSTLLAEARLMARVVEDGLARGAGASELDPLVDEAARGQEVRVTIVALGGRVLADSEVSGPDLDRLENHADRPEVKEALATGTGVSLRHSATVGRDLLYAAVPVRHAGRTVGVARVALSLGLTASLARPLGEIMEAARQFAAGNLGARIRVRRSDELGELARILNFSADQLQERLAEIARERARIEAILSAMEDGVLAVDHRRNVLLANQALSRGLDLKEPVGRHYVEV